MNELTLSDVRDFHADLLTIRSAGIPLCTNFASTLAPLSSSAMQDALHSIEVTLTNICGSGRQVSEVLEQDARFSRQYISALRVWFQTKRTPTAFEPMAATLISDRRRWGMLAVSLVAPASWLCLAYLAMIIICGGLVPMLERQSRQMWAEPGPVLSVMLGLRAWMPVWMFVVPLICALGWLYLIRRRKRPPTTTTQALSGTEAIRRAQLAEQAAHMLESGVPIQRAIEYLRETACTLSPVAELKSNLAAVGAPAELPPLLQWAVADAPREMADQESPPAIESPVALRRAASIYRGIAKELERAHQSQRGLQITLVALGGLLVLGVALSVFGPLIEMMLYLATPTRS